MTFTFHISKLFFCSYGPFNRIVLWHVSHTQGGGAIKNFGVALTFEGSATFTSCSAEASGSSNAYAVSGGE